MSKRLPYFQFEPAEWLAGDIMFCSLQAQGLFTTIKALYWQKDCDLSLEQAQKRLKNEEFFNELINEKIIKIDQGKIIITFLNEQWLKLSEKSRINSENGSKGGRPKKPIKSENKANGFESLLKTESETKALRREEIKEEDNKNKEDKNIPIDFVKLLDFFNSVTGKKAKVVTEKVKKQINARLKEGFSKDDIASAIKNCFNDNYHKEENHKYLTLEFITRSDKLEKYSAIKPEKKKNEIPDHAKRNQL